MEGDAGTSQLNPAAADDTLDESVAVSPDDATECPEDTTPGPDSVEESATTAVEAGSAEVAGSPFAPSSCC